MTRPAESLMMSASCSSRILNCSTRAPRAMGALDDAAGKVAARQHAHLADFVHGVGDVALVGLIPNRL